MVEAWYADDFLLSEGIVRDVETRAGIARTPAPRGSNPSLSNRTGELWRPKMHGAGSFVLNMWCAAEAPRAQVDALYDDVLRATARPHRLTRYRHVRADGSARYAMGELVSAIEPAPIGQAGWRFGLEVRIPDGYWLDEAEQTMVVIPTSNDQVFALDAFGGSSAPMERLRITVMGGASGLRLADYTDDVEGDWLAYSVGVPDGQGIEFDAGEWQPYGLNGLIVNEQAISYSGGRFLTIPAAAPGKVPLLRVQSTNRTANTRIEVAGPPAYLV